MNVDRMEDGTGEQIDFVTLGMFILDDIYPPPNASDQTPKINIIGGAGTYSAIGARLLSPPPNANRVGWIIDAGTDFPPHVLSIIESWQTSAIIRPRDALTTRGWNGYGENEHRAFKYLTDKKRLTADDLSPVLLRSRSFHLICYPSRCIEIVQRTLQRRLEAFGEGEARPLFIWEPVPNLCTPAEFENTMLALQYVDVISPNHEELGAMFSFRHGSSVDRVVVEQQAQQLLTRGVGAAGTGAVVVRAGKDGCYVATRQLTKWLPAYHDNASKVVDPTGGGNGFLGGLAVGLVRTGGDVIESARWGCVAASFCIEQVGMPRLTSAGSSEQWNGEAVTGRLTEFRQRTT